MPKPTAPNPTALEPTPSGATGGEVIKTQLAVQPSIGDVRGRGLFLGVELVRDRTTLEPAAAEAGRVIEAMKQAGILLSTDGPLHNVLKTKPPLVVTRSDAERVAETLDRVLATLSAS